MLTEEEYELVRDAVLRLKELDDHVGFSSICSYVATIAMEDEVRGLTLCYAVSDTINLIRDYYVNKNMTAEDCGQMLN